MVDNEGRMVAESDVARRRTRWRSWPLAVVAAIVAATATAMPAGADAATSRYVAITPSRLVDTRAGAPVGAFTSRDFQVTGGVVPGDATAVFINVTATDAAGGGWLQVLPTGRAAIGSSSTINLDFAGQTIPNAVFAPIGDGGRITVFTTFTTHVLIDVSGYFVPATSSAAGRMVPVTPTRLLDTRSQLGWSPPAPPAPVNPGDTKNCDDFATWSAANTWYRTYYSYYGDVANLDGDADGIVCESLSGAPSVAPPPPTVPGSTQTRIQDGDVVRLLVAGRGGVPTSGVSAVVMNVTVVAPTAAGYVQIAPTPVNKGASSNLNPEVGRTVANLAVVPLAPGGTVDIYTDLYVAGGVDLLADVVGYVTNGSAATSSAGLFVPVPPNRQLDTRLPAPQPERPAGSITDVDVSDVAPGASAIAGNLTSVAGGPNAYLQLAAKPVNPGATSSLNTSYENQTIANAVVSPVGAGGLLQVFTYGSTHELLDVTGWFTSG